MLRKEEIIDYVSENEGVNTFGVVQKFSKKHKIKTESVKNHIYRLKKYGFLEEKKNKLYSSNPFDEEFQKIIESKNKFEMYKNLSELNDKMLRVIGTMSPHVESKLRYLLMESLVKAYREAE